MQAPPKRHKDAADCSMPLVRFRCQEVARHGSAEPVRMGFDAAKCLISESPARRANQSPYAFGNRTGTGHSSRPTRGIEPGQQKRFSPVAVGRCPRASRMCPERLAATGGLRSAPRRAWPFRKRAARVRRIDRPRCTPPMGHRLARAFPCKSPYKWLTPCVVFILTAVCSWRLRSVAIISWTSTTFFTDS
jgi:hypothetical protein